MPDFNVVSAELAGKIREFLHGEADYDPRALLRDVVFETRTTALEAVEAGGCAPPVMVSAADQQGFLRDLALYGTGCMRVVDGIASNVPAALIHKPANGGYPASHEHRLRGAIANTRWSDVPLDKLRAVAEALSPQERAPGAMTAMHERLQDVIAEMRRAVKGEAVTSIGDWADRLEATLTQQQGGEQEGDGLPVAFRWVRGDEQTEWHGIHLFNENADRKRHHWGWETQYATDALRSKQPAASEGDERREYDAFAGAINVLLSHGIATSKAVEIARDLSDNTSKQAAVEAVALHVLVEADTWEAASFIFGSSADGFCDAELFIGEHTDDDGKAGYGLLIRSADYPDEGVVPLAELPRQTTPPRHPADEGIAFRAVLKRYQDGRVFSNPHTRQVARAIAQEAEAAIQAGTP